MSHLGNNQPTGPGRHHSIEVHSSDDVPTQFPPNPHPHQPMPEPASDALPSLTAPPAPLIPEPSTSPHVRMVEPSIPHVPAQQDSYADSKHSAWPGGFVQPSEKPQRPDHPRNPSWDLLGGIGKNIEGFDTRNATQAHLQFAEGDTPKNKLARSYHYLLNLSIVTRWFLFIVPVLGLLWIPGIVQLTAVPKANIWSIALKWWSIWFSVCWVGWWVFLAAAMALPIVLRHTLGVVAVGLRKYIDWLSVRIVLFSAFDGNTHSIQQALQRYMALFAWSLAQWIAFTQLILRHRPSADQNDANAVAKQANNNSNLDLISKILFGVMLCTAILLGEKFAIQWIAFKFHERSYAERIAEQKVQTSCLTTLYKHSSEIPGRSDTLKDGQTGQAAINPKKLLKGVLKGVKGVASTTTTALGNVASEIAGSSVLQPNSPAAVVATALSSANKTRLLARRIFYSFVQPGATALVITDIAHYFPDYETAEIAFAMFDKDGNHDVTEDEIEMACLEIHRERLSLANSMRDIDSAVGRLDNILMSLYFAIAALVIAVTLETRLVTLLTGAGSLVLALSWLIGASAAEVLTSIIFLFIKHPYDVGDRVDIDTGSYIVKEMRLLSTIFVDT
ncbi:hypothetical protein FRC06_006530, partial [Ceratobasidium sp. 370]